MRTLGLKDHYFEADKGPYRTPYTKISAVAEPQNQSTPQGYL